MKTDRIRKLEKRIENIKRLEERADRMSNKYWRQRIRMQKLLAKYKILDNDKSTNLNQIK